MAAELRDTKMLAVCLVDICKNMYEHAGEFVLFCCSLGPFTKLTLRGRNVTFLDKESMHSKRNTVYPFH